MTVTSEQVAELAKPFAPENVHWRAQTVANGKALALAYIDARDVMDRLDAVCGPENWQDRYVETPKGRILCTLSIHIGDEWVSKSDGAGETDVEGEKGALSDALKRAAVHWGIGRYLYSLPNVWVPCELGQNGKFKKFTDDPWKYVRNPPPPRSDDGLKFALDGIAACETIPVLTEWWNRNSRAVPDYHLKEVEAAYIARGKAIGLMDRKAA